MLRKGGTCLERKTTNTAAAYVGAITEKQGRNAD